MPNYFDLALAITYAAHYHDELFTSTHTGKPLRRAYRRSEWLDTGRDEVIRDDLICLAAAD
ncbi:MAG: hypothetical protein BWY79_01816 [Actinobacteria bacterium ADurb.Bin444]|nr:MAG: hypothetical protein BWY79_01816 [Actinobacteria bacterium ADurb.Bin444]